MWQNFNMTFQRAKLHHNKLAVDFYFRKAKLGEVRCTLPISMQRVNIQNNLITAENFKCTEININNNFISSQLDGIRQKNFFHGLQNARNLLSDLEDSLHKSSVYEKKLLRCKSSHAHIHAGEEWWDDGFDKDEEEESKDNTAIRKASRGQVDLAESWSTMSIVCLQYQYEELSKRYESLLHAFNNKCSDVTTHDKALSRLKQRAAVTHAQLAHAHKALISVGEKYMTLKKKRIVQLCLYEQKIEYLKGRVRDVVSAVDRARLQLDSQISRNMAAELDSDYSLLLAEMRKCNKLYIENLQLKARLEEVMPGSVTWN